MAIPPPRVADIDSAVMSVIKRPRGIILLSVAELQSLMLRDRRVHDAVARDPGTQQTGMVTIPALAALFADPACANEFETRGWTKLWEAIVAEEDAVDKVWTHFALHRNAEVRLWQAVALVKHHGGETAMVVGVHAFVTILPPADAADASNAAETQRKFAGWRAVVVHVHGRQVHLALLPRGAQTPEPLRRWRDAQVSAGRTHDATLAEGNEPARWTTRLTLDMDHVCLLPEHATGFVCPCGCGQRFVRDCGGFEGIDQRGDAPGTSAGTNEDAAMQRAQQEMVMRYLQHVAYSVVLGNCPLADLYVARGHMCHGVKGEENYNSEFSKRVEVCACVRPKQAPGPCAGPRHAARPPGWAGSEAAWEGLSEAAQAAARVALPVWCEMCAPPIQQGGCACVQCGRQMGPSADGGAGAEPRCQRNCAKARMPPTWPFPADDGAGTFSSAATEKEREDATHSEARSSFEKLRGKTALEATTVVLQAGVDGTACVVSRTTASCTRSSKPSGTFAGSKEITITNLYNETGFNAKEDTDLGRAVSGAVEKDGEPFRVRGPRCVCFSGSAVDGQVLTCHFPMRMLLHRAADAMLNQLRLEAAGQMVAAVGNAVITALRAAREAARVREDQRAVRDAQCAPGDGARVGIACEEFQQRVNEVAAAAAQWKESVLGDFASAEDTAAFQRAFSAAGLGECLLQGPGDKAALRLRKFHCRLLESLLPEGGKTSALPAAAHDSGTAARQEGAAEKRRKVEPDEFPLAYATFDVETAASLPAKREEGLHQCIEVLVECDPATVQEPLRGDSYAGVAGVLRAFLTEKCPRTGAALGSSPWTGGAIVALREPPQHHAHSSRDLSVGNSDARFLVLIGPSTVRYPDDVHNARHALYNLPRDPDECSRALYGASGAQGGVQVVRAAVASPWQCPHPLRMARLAAPTVAASADARGGTASGGGNGGAARIPEAVSPLEAMPGFTHLGFVYEVALLANGPEDEGCAGDQRRLTRARCWASELVFLYALHSKGSARLGLPGHKDMQSKGSGLFQQPIAWQNGGLTSLLGAVFKSPADAAHKLLTIVAECNDWVDVSVKSRTWANALQRLPEESPASMPERWVNDPACYAAAVAEMFLDLLVRNADQKRRVVLCGYSTGVELGVLHKLASYLRAFGKDRDKVKEVVKLLPSASEGGSLFLDTLTNTELLFSTVPAGEYFDWRNLACGGSKKMDAVRSSDRTLPTAGAVRAEVAAEPDAAPGEPRVSLNERVRLRRLELWRLPPGMGIDGLLARLLPAFAQNWQGHVGAYDALCNLVHDIVALVCLRVLAGGLAPSDAGASALEIFLPLEVQYRYVSAVTDHGAVAWSPCVAFPSVGAAPAAGGRVGAPVGGGGCRQAQKDAVEDTHTESETVGGGGAEIGVGGGGGGAAAGVASAGDEAELGALLDTIEADGRLDEFR